MEENLRRQLEQNEKEMEAIKLGYEQRLVEALAKVSHTTQKKLITKAKKKCFFHKKLNIFLKFSVLRMGKQKIESFYILSHKKSFYRK
jgi:hypothetical protein